MGKNLKINILGKNQMVKNVPKGIDGKTPKSTDLFKMSRANIRKNRWLINRLLQNVRTHLKRIAYQLNDWIGSTGKSGKILALNRSL